MFPSHTSTLSTLKNSNYGKGYIHCIKYRIFLATTDELSKQDSTLTATNVTEWLGEQERTWRNISAKCRRASRALSTLRARRSDLTAQQKHDYRVLKFLMDGPLTVIPSDHWNSTQPATEEELLDHDYRQEALKVKLKDVERMTLRTLTS